MFGWAALGFALFSLLLLPAALSRIAGLFLCAFGIVWLGTVISFLLGMVSLARSVSWSLVHALDQQARDQALADRMSPRPSAPPHEPDELIALS